MLRIDEKEWDGASVSRSADDYKRRTREQWEANPCGANAAGDLEFGTREYFDAIEGYRYNDYSPWLKEAVEFDQFRNKRLLEIGFGTGTDLLQFARAGALVTGVDLTPRSVDIARRRFDIYGEHGQFLIGDGENLGFPDESFDVVYSFGVLHHTPDTAGAIKEIRRVLRPGGRAIVMLYHRASLAYWGGLILKRGILRGELMRHSVAEIMSRNVEFGAAESCPLVKAYTREEARRLFCDFDECEISVNQLTRPELRPFGALLPEPAFRWLAQRFGWNLIIKAKKSEPGARQ